MPKPLSELEFTIRRKEEVQQLVNRSSKAITVAELAQKFIDPETGKPIQIGEAIEIGPFDSQEEGKNWLNYYLPDTYKHPLLDWGKLKTKSGNRKAPISKSPIKRDGKWYFQLIRVTE